MLLPRSRRRNRFDEPGVIPFYDEWRFTCPRCNTFVGLYPTEGEAKDAARRHRERGRCRALASPRS